MQIAKQREIIASERSAMTRYRFFLRGYISSGFLCVVGLRNVRQMQCAIDTEQ